MNIIEDLKLQYKMGGVAQKLIYWNVALYAIPYGFFAILSLFRIDIDFINYVSLSSNPAQLFWKPWSIMSYFFFHAGFFHILFNMLVLNFSTRLFSTYFSQKQLLSLYFVGGVFAGLIYMISYYIFPLLANLDSRLVGASGAIMAVLFAVTCYAPLMEVRLFLFGNVKLWHIALGLIILDLIQLPLENTGGHLAHLGGALFGYFYMKQLQQGNDLALWFSKSIDATVNLFGKRKTTKLKKVHQKYYQSPPKATAKIVTKDKTQQQIDEILDKIGQSGYDSLTKEEKEFLFKAGK